MRNTKLYRFILALCVAVLSTASAMHDIVHHGLGSENSQSEYSATIAHESHSTGCEFCAKGPTVSTEAPALSAISLTSVDEAPQATLEEIYIRFSVRLRTLRGPPTA